MRPTRTHKVQIDCNGYLNLIAPLDYETEKAFELAVDVFDKSNNPLTATKRFTIEVINVNDNAPKLDGFNAGEENKCELSIYEDVQIGLVKFLGLIISFSYTA